MHFQIALGLVVIGCIGTPECRADDPTSCFIGEAEVSRVKSDSEREALKDARAVILTPCRGTVSGEGLWLWFATEEGRTQRRYVKPPQTLQQVLGNTTTVPLTGGNSIWLRLYSALTAQSSVKRGSSRFDSKNGVPLQGTVLPGKDLNLPLAPFQWSPVEPVDVKAADGKPIRLVPQRGRILIPVSRMQAGLYDVTQGPLKTSIEIVPEPEATAIRAAIAEIDADGLDPALSALRRAIFLSEQGYVLNLVSERVND